tara:strand:+ start:6018 stop:6596 length:579 start_codon:yes stop_codon:yes gene_type:complete
MGFGEAFGRLIKVKRGTEGLTQQELAVRAFGDEGYKTRISELENGKVSNPQAKTIDALVVALGISEEELSQLNTEEDAQWHYIDDTQGDYFDLPGRDSVKGWIDVTMGGGVALRHDRPWEIEIKGFEFFAENGSLVLLTADGSRRPFRCALSKRIVDQLLIADHIYVNLWERGPQPMVLEYRHFPLKVFRLS